jgi:twinkle protein
MATFAELGIQEKSGKIRYSTICPKCSHLRQHHKTTPCLTVNNEPDNQWYHCSHCSWGGNLGSMEKYSKVIENSKIPKQIAETYSKEIREYWESRGIDIKLCLSRKIFEFSFAKKPTLGFPTYISQTLVDVKYLNIRWKKGDEFSKWWNLDKKYGTKTLPWGLEYLNFPPDEPKIIIWTEGHVDTLTWLQCGYKNVISVPSGAPSTKAEKFDHEFDYITDKYVQSKIAEADLHIISTDGDEPGIKLRNHLALILGKEKCKHIVYPVGYKDVNEIYKGVNKEDKKLPELGKKGIDECYRNIASFPIAGIISPFDVREDLKILAHEGFTPGLKCGITEIDNLYTEKSKRLQVVTGVPGSGKSTYVRWHEIEVVRFNSTLDIKYGWFSPENRPVAREYAKMAEVCTGQYFKEGWKNSMTPELRDRTLRWLAKHFFVISPDRKNFDTFNGKIKADKVNTLDALCQYLVYLKKTENIFGYVIDAWNKIEHEQPRNMTETQYVSSQLDLLVDFNEYYDLHGIIIAHPTKIEKIGINYRFPCLYDIKGSSAWKEKSDVGIILHRNVNRKRSKEDMPDDADEDDKYYVDPDTPTILRTERIRFEEEGNMNRIKLKMDYTKGGRFFIYKDEKVKGIEPLPGKLNPPDKEEEDGIFNGEEDNLTKIPF